MKISDIFKASVGLMFLVWGSFCTLAQNAEINLSFDHILPLVRTEPYPSSGIVKVNSPYLIWAPVYTKKQGYNTYLWDQNYRYRCELSRNEDFSGENLIESKLQDWTFFNPHIELAKGKWYWRYASVQKTTGKETWSEPVAFEITGSERLFVTPSPEKLVQKIPLSHPRFLATKEEIGKLRFPKDDVTKFLKAMDSKTGEPFPETLIYNDRSVLDKKEKELDPEFLHRYIDKATKEKFHPHVNQAVNFVKAYLITGDRKYADEGLRRYYYIKKQYLDIYEKGYRNDFTQGNFYFLLSNVFDGLYDFINENERKDIIEKLSGFQKDTYLHYKDNAILLLMEAHSWQHHIRNFFTNSMILLHHVPDAEKWLEFVYDLWTIRAPVGSGDDGGWIEGNGYMSVNNESLFVMPFLLSKYTGVDYFEHPWYKNVSSYLFLSSPIGHISGAYGDNAPEKRSPTETIELVEALTHIKENPYGKEYIKLAENLGSFNNGGSIEKGGNIYWFKYQNFPFPKGNPTVIPLAKSMAFRDVGVAVMNTDVYKPQKNLMISFASSPYGLAGHAHACQNTFNIQYGGDPLFFRTGFYSSWADAHSLQSYRHTRAHNGILADGIGTSFSSDGYGWIPRFIESKSISYVCGDASNAYDGIVSSDNFKFDRWNVKMTYENGFGNPGVSRFRRHIAFLKPNIIVIYDELEAKKPVDWSWLIHSWNPMTASNNKSFYTENTRGKGQLTLFCNKDFNTCVTDTFYSPAVDWLGNAAKKGKTYTNHWHGKAETGKESSARFLAVIEVKDKSEKTPFLKVEKNANNEVTIGNWKICVEFDGERLATLQITNEKEGSGLSLGSAPLVLQGKTYPHKIKGSTLVTEDFGSLIQEAVDELPAAAVYR
jgi:hypothetical protein